MRYQVRHLLIAMALAALTVQWSVLHLSPSTFRGQISGTTDLPPWNWLGCALALTAIFLERPRTTIRVLTLLFLAVGLWFDRGTYTAFGWLSIGLATAAALWLLVPLVWPKVGADTVLAVMIPTMMALGMVLMIDVLARPYLSDAMEFRIQRLQYALDRYRAKHGTYPPPYRRNAQGERTHSWRALLIPYLSSVPPKDPLAGYRWDEPWDGWNNRHLTGRTPAEFAQFEWGLNEHGECNCFAPMGHLRDSRSTQRVVEAAPTFDYVHRLMIGSTTIPHWSEPVECEFYLDGTVVAPGPSWQSVRREETILQLKLHDTTADPLSTATQTAAPPPATSPLDARITIFHCPQVVRHWGGSAAFKPPRSAYANFWVALAGYVLLDVLISFGVCGAARKKKRGQVQSLEELAACTVELAPLDAAEKELPAGQAACIVELVPLRPAEESPHEPASRVSTSA